MTREEKLTEAKLMAVEAYFKQAVTKALLFQIDVDCYDYAKVTLSAIRDLEIQEELADHEASLETHEPHSIELEDKQA